MRRLEEMQTLGSHQPPWTALSASATRWRWAWGLEWVLQKLLQDVQKLLQGRCTLNWASMGTSKEDPSPTPWTVREAEERNFHLAFSSVLGRMMWCVTCAWPSSPRRLLAATYVHFQLTEDWMENWEWNWSESVWHVAQVSAMTVIWDWGGSVHNRRVDFTST